MEIRLASVDDIDDIMNVENSAFIAGIREEKSVFLERIKRCPELFLIFQEGDKVAGYLSAEIMEKIPETAEELELGHLPVDIHLENNNCTEKQGEGLSQKVRKAFIYISSFAILPEFRGKGTGRRLWNESISFLKEHCGIEKFLLLVNEEWKGAFHIYESSGFRTINRFPGFFVSEEKGRSDGILMSL